jgi:hypothetical protein
VLQLLIVGALMYDGLRCEVTHDIEKRTQGRELPLTFSYTSVAKESFNHSFTIE